LAAQSREIFFLRWNEQPKRLRQSVEICGENSCLFQNIDKILSIREKLIISRSLSYGFIPALSLELLFRLAGIHVFLILRFSGSIKHLGFT
jgi:hypothetical protein